MDLSVLEAIAEKRAAKANDASKMSTVIDTDKGKSRDCSADDNEEANLKHRHHSGPSSCTSSPFDSLGASCPQKDNGATMIIAERDDDAAHFNGWKTNPKSESPSRDSKPQIVHASSNSRLWSDRVVEKPPVPRINIDKTEDELRLGDRKLGITRFTGRDEEKDELVPEEREILDELVEAINCDDFKRVMFIQNVIREKNGEQWDVLFRNLPKNCQCVLLDYEKSLSKEDIRAIRSEVERELDDEQLEVRHDKQQHYFGSPAPELAFRSRTAPALNSYDPRGISPPKLQESTEAKEYRRSPPQGRRSVSPERRYVSPERRSVSPERRYVSPERGYVSPERRSVSPERRSVSPERRSVSPERRFPSPSRLNSLEELRAFYDQELARLKAESVDAMAVMRDRDFWKEKSHSLELQLRRINCELTTLKEEVQRVRHQTSSWPSRVAELEAANAELQHEVDRHERRDRQMADRTRHLEERLNGAQQHRAMEKAVRERPKFDEAFIRRVLADYDAQGRELDHHRRLAATHEGLLAKTLSENECLQQRLSVMERSLDRLHKEKEAAILRSFNGVPFEQHGGRRSSSKFSEDHEEFEVEKRQTSAPLRRHASFNSKLSYWTHSDEQRTSSAPPTSNLEPREELRQLEKRFDHLQVEKRKLETELSHLPAPGSTLNRRQLKSEESRIEDRLERVTKELGSLRLTLKQRRVLQ